MRSEGAAGGEANGLEKPGASVNAVALLFIGQAVPDITEAIFTRGMRVSAIYLIAPYQDARHARLLSDDRRVHPSSQANPLPGIPAASEPSSDPSADLHSALSLAAVKKSLR